MQHYIDTAPIDGGQAVRERLQSIADDMDINVIYREQAQEKLLSLQ